tara:strand:+ start:32 stop:280 length:249 start_codon:yes stop_codon:yes gene_type:complete
MGGFIRSVFKAITKVSAPVQIAQSAPVQEAATAVVDTKKKQAALGSGYGSKGTIMTTSQGVEDDANVSKTVLGAGTKKKIKA